MVLNELKQIRDELRDSAKRYDNSFRQVALIAAEELVQEEEKIKQHEQNMSASASLTPSVDKQYFLNKYGSLKNAKAAYTKVHGEQKYGRSWSDFIAVVKKLSVPQPQALTLEARITKIEDFLVTLGYKK